MIWGDLVDLLSGCGVDVDGGRVGVSIGMGSDGDRARPEVGVTLGLFTSMSTLVVVKGGGIVSFLGVWRCGRYEYRGVVLSSVGNNGWK